LRIRCYAGGEKQSLNCWPPNAEEICDIVLCQYNRTVLEPEHITLFLNGPTEAWKSHRPHLQYGVQLVTDAGTKNTSVPNSAVSLVHWAMQKTARQSR
jgi:hypothetical protein